MAEALVTAPLSKQRFHCEVCNALYVSYDLKHHYQAKTDWKLLERLRSGGEADGEHVDQHTHYMLTGKFSQSNLPNYIYHK